MCSGPLPNLELRGHCLDKEPEELHDGDNEEGENIESSTVTSSTDEQRGVAPKSSTSFG
jgi:hypothetical protein